MARGKGGAVPALGGASAVAAAAAFVVFAAVCQGALGACLATGGASLPAGETTVEFEHDGLSRSFIVHVPQSYANSTPTPVYFMFHGYTDSADRFILTSNLAEVSEEKGFIGVAPNGWQRSWNAGGCCGRAMEANVDDVGMFSAMVDLLETLVCIDRSRLFAAGFSNGGEISYRIACERSDLVAAIGPMGAMIFPEFARSCLSQTKPVPSMHIHGIDDGTVLYPEGVASVNYYVNRVSDCAAPPRETFVNGTVSCDTYSDCSDDIENVFCSITGKGHTYPACTPNSREENCGDIDGTRALWDFFVASVAP